MSNQSENETQYCLELIGIGKSFHGLRAVDNVNLKVKSGQRVAIIGPNGAGKTTLFNMISGEFPPTDGKVILFGEDVTELPNNKRVYKGLARTYQITTLFPEFSVIENVILALEGTRKTKYQFFRSLKKQTELFEEAEELLGRVNLESKKNELIKNLSYGDQRLVELTLAMASDPKIICLDEPNAGLSAAESRVMINAIKNLRSDITILLIEHDIDLVFEVAEYIMVLQDGKVVASDEKDAIRNNPRVQQIYLGEEVEESAVSG